MLSTLDEFPGFRKLVEKTLVAIKPIQEWNRGLLDEIKDANLLYVIPENCKYVQLAAQDDDRVYLNTKFEGFLKPYQQGLLRFHEATYWIARLNGKKSSYPVRALFREGLAMKTATTDYQAQRRKLGDKIAGITKRYANLVENEIVRARFYSFIEPLIEQLKAPTGHLPQSVENLLYEHQAYFYQFFNGKNPEEEKAFKDAYAKVFQIGEIGSSLTRSLVEAFLNIAPPQSALTALKKLSEVVDETIPGRAN